MGIQTTDPQKWQMCKLTKGAHLYPCQIKSNLNAAENVIFKSFSI